MSDLDRSIAQAYQRSGAAADLRRRLADVRGTGTSDGGLVTAVVSGTGALLDLRIDAAAMRTGPGELGDAIVAAAGHATDDARQRCYTLLALALGDEAAAEVERSDRPVPARAMGWDTVTAPGATAAGERPADDSDDDVFSFDPSIFRSDR